MKLTLALAIIPALLAIVHGTDSSKKPTDDAKPTDAKPTDIDPSKENAKKPVEDKAQVERDAEELKFKLEEEKLKEYKKIAAGFAALTTDAEKLKTNKAAEAIKIISAFLNPEGDGKQEAAINMIGEAVDDIRALAQHKLLKLQSPIRDLWYQLPEKLADLKVSVKEDEDRVKRLFDMRDAWSKTLLDYAEKENENFKKEVGDKSKSDKGKDEKGKPIQSDFQAALKKYKALPLDKEAELPLVVLESVLIASQLTSPETDRVRADILAKFSNLCSSLSLMASESKSNKIRSAIKDNCHDVAPMANAAASSLFPIYRSHLLHAVIAIIVLLLVIGGVVVFFLTK